MSANQQLSYLGDDNNDGVSDVLYTRRLREGQPNVDLTVSSEINNQLLNKKTLIRNDTTKKPNVKLTSATASGSRIIGMTDTADRPADANAEVTFSQSGTYSEAFENKPGKRIPKAGAFAEAGVGRARAEFSVFEAEAKGPNAFARADASLVGVGAMARAEIASASAQAGPVAVKLGLGVDTGVSVGLDGLEVKFLGTGFSVGPKTSISLLGSEVSCSVM